MANIPANRTARRVLARTATANRPPRPQYEDDSVGFTPRVLFPTQEGAGGRSVRLGHLRRLQMGKRKQVKGSKRRQQQSGRLPISPGTKAPPKTRSYADWTPYSWIADGANEVWMRCYRIGRVGPSALSERKSLDFGRVRVVVHGGTLGYMHVSEAFQLDVQGEDFVLETSRIRHPTTPEGAYLILMAPFDNGGRLQTEAAAKEQIEVTTGLLVAALGLNIAYRPVFDIGFDLPAGNQIAVTDPAFAPQLYDPPDVSDRGLANATGLHAAMDLLDGSSQARTRLSLRWYVKSLHDFGTDSFLAMWIALETLAMPDTTNIRPLSEAVGRTHGTEATTASAQFHIGRLCGLRGQIVHEGALIAVPPMMLRYVDALYRDVLLDHLAMPPRRHLEGALNDPDFDASDFLPSLGSGAS
jgi:hypothetical protein